MLTRVPLDKLGVVPQSSGIFMVSSGTSAPLLSSSVLLSSKLLRQGRRSAFRRPWAVPRPAAHAVVCFEAGSYGCRPSRPPAAAHR